MKFEPKVKLALKFFADIQQKQQALDDKLKQLEEKFSKSISDINVQLGQQTNVIAENAMESEGNGSTSTHKLKFQHYLISLTHFIDISRREREKRRKLNVVVHKVLEFTSSNAQERKTHDFDRVHTILQKHRYLDLYRNNY